MILLPDHIATIYGVKQLVDDFCKKNHLKYIIYNLNDLHSSLKNQRLVDQLRFVQEIQEILLFIVPASIRIDQTFYDVFERKILSFGTAATGVDHVDYDFINKYSLLFFDAQGENKDSVVEYTLSVLPYVVDIEKIIYREIQIGIVGFGRIGSLLGKVLQNLGFSYIAVDPFVFPETFLQNTHRLKDCNVITFHTPLTTAGPYPTFGMIHLDFLKNLNQNTVLINTSRGKIFTSDGYSYAIQNCICAFDVYPCEPPLDEHLHSQNLKIATPHTAGYNWISRFRSMYKVLEKFAMSFDFELDKALEDYYPNRFEIEIFDSILTETVNLKQNKDYFFIRNQYPIRANIKQQVYNPNWNPFYKQLYEYFCYL